MHAIARYLLSGAVFVLFVLAVKTYVPSLVPTGPPDQMQRTADLWCYGLYAVAFVILCILTTKKPAAKKK